MPVFARVAGAAVRVVAPAELLAGPGAVVLVGVLVLPGTRPPNGPWPGPPNGPWPGGPNGPWPGGPNGP